MYWLLCARSCSAEQGKASWSSVLALYMWNSGAAQQQCSPMRDMVEKEPSTPPAAQAEQRKMPHQCCFAQCLHVLMMQWGEMWFSWLRKWFQCGGLLAQAFHVLPCYRWFKSRCLCCPFYFLVLQGSEEVLDAEQVALWRWGGCEYWGKDYIWNQGGPWFPNMGVWVQAQ